MGWPNTFATMPGGNVPASDLDENFNAALPLGGGTMTGTLVLSGNPSANLDAAPKQYVDATGRILQSVAVQSSAYVSGTTVITIGTSKPTNTQGTQALSCSITPKSSTSSLHIQAKIPVFQLATATIGVAALFQNTTVDAIAATFGSPNTPIILDAFVGSTGTVTTTFNLRYGPSTSGTMFLNGNTTLAIFTGAMFITLIVDEIAA